MKKKSIKDYIRKQVKKEMDKVLQTPGKVTNFTINWKALDPNLLWIPYISMKDLEPKDRTISFVIKSNINNVPHYMTLSSCKFKSYNRPHFLESEPEYVVSTIEGIIEPGDAVEPTPRHTVRKRKTKPRFTPSQKKAMK